MAEARRITTCLTDQPVRATGYALAPEFHSVTFVPIGRPVSLRTANAGGRLRFLFKLDNTVARLDGERTHFEVLSVAYSYQVMDAGEHELLAYH